MKNYLIDIDGTICDDIKNEDSHLYAKATPYKNASFYLRKLSSEGNKITYFTSREEKDREVTLNWLKQYQFPIDGLIMNKPRGGNYKWIDNLNPVGIHFTEEMPKEWTENMFEVICSK